MGVKLEMVSEARGDDARFEAFYRSQWAPMVRLATMLVGRSDAAEDIVQDAFLRLRDVFGTVEKPAAYLRTAVVNACKNHHRRRDVEERHRPRTVPSVLDAELDETWAKLQSLSPRRRAALVLRFYLDMSLAEVASTLGCRTGTAASLVHRGLADLRKVL